MAYHASRRWLNTPNTARVLTILFVYPRLRKTAPSLYPRAVSLLAENPYTPPSVLAQAVMHASRLLHELVVVREWLHETAPEPPHLDATTGYWRFTKNQTMQALRTGKNAGFLAEMDPDAVGRIEGSSLAADDAVRPGLSWTAD